jgi:hypothetical protein
MKRVMEIAEAVVEDLAEYGAVLELAPEYTLKEAKTLRVVVVPVGVTHHLLSRGHRQDDYKIQIGVLKKATEDELEGLLEKVETIATGFLEKILAGARCHKVEHAPLFVPDHLKERRQFTSVIELTFKEIVRT